MRLLISSSKYQVMKILLKHSLHAPCKLIVRVIMEVELVLYSTYIDQDDAGKYRKVDFRESLNGSGE